MFREERVCRVDFAVAGETELCDVGSAVEECWGGVAEIAVSRIWW